MTDLEKRQDSLSLVKQALLAVEQMKARLEAAERQQREPIAIIGLGCRFPGQAGSPAAFWKLLANGVCAVTPIPPGRWEVEAFYDPNPDAPGKAYTRYGAFLDQIDRFDAQFFNIAPVEAASLDPQQRLLLEVSWEALEHAGVAGAGLRGSRTGVFAGLCNSDYMLYTIGSRDPQRVDAFSGTGSASSIAAGRLSYFYDFHGPNFPVDTACSSSLVALHLAVHSLRRQECDMALAAGVSAMLSPELFVYFAKTQALSAGPACRAFDARADGYVRGEGCGVIVLKRLSDALAAGDNILAVVRGSAVNHDGRTAGLTAPNGPAQQSVIRAALADAGVDPAHVTYVETHGTGTPLGDPIEVQALAAAYAVDGRPPIYLGSVKTNIGHLEGAAGIAAAIKTALMLHHRQLVPHLHFEQPSPHIPWAALPVEVVTAPQPWPVDRPLLAGISSFGFSGTNVHVIMAAPPEARTETVNGTSPATVHANGQPPATVLPLSARSASALSALAGRYSQHLREQTDQSLGDVCHTAAVGRAHFAHRLAVVGATPLQVAERLADFAEGRATTGLQAHQARPGSPARVVFQFSGQGAQHVGMGQKLYAQQPAFRAALDQCDDLLRPHLGLSIRAVMFGEAPTPAPASAPVSLDETWLTQPALFAFEYALACLWQAWGVEPAAVTGHSIGEYVAACLAGVFSLEAALPLVAARGRLMQSLSEAGAMVVAFAPEAEVAAAIQGQADVAIAAINGPDNVVVSGARASVKVAAGALEEAGVITRPLRVSHAFHSPLMEPMLAEFGRLARAVTFHAPQLPLISNLTGQFFAAGAVPDAEYWTEHLRQPVRYYAGLQTLLASGHNVFLEVGPRPILTDLGQRYAGEAARWLAASQPVDEGGALLDSLAGLYVYGCPIDWSAIYPRQHHRRLALPTYPFERKRFWLDPPAAIAAPAAAPAASRNGGEPLLNAFVEVLE